MKFWKKALVPIIGVLALLQSVSAFHFSGMQNLSDFIKDIVDIVPDLIPLVIVFLIIGVVIAFGYMIKKLFNRIGI